jgi:tetratricopeptide (TPR) repeat protein
VAHSSSRPELRAARSASASIEVRLLPHSGHPEEAFRRAIMQGMNSLSWEQLQARAVELSQKAGGPHGVTPELLWEVVNGDRAPPLDDAFLREIHSRIDELAPLPKLVLCLQLMRWLTRPQHADGSYAFARTAVRALYVLGRLELFPLRLVLLEGILARELSPEAKAELLFMRGNTRLALASQAAALMELAIQDLRAAGELARSRGLTRLELQAEFALARAEFLELPGRQPSLADALEQRVTRLEGLLGQAAQVSLAGDLHEILAELQGRLLMLGQEKAAARAIHHARQAVALADEPSLRATRQASLAQLSRLHGTPEDKAAALQIARQAVESLPAEAGDIHSVQAHSALGTELMHHGQPAEAVGHLEYALSSLSRQGPSSNRNLIRLQLAQALLNQEKPGDARHHLEIVFEEAHVLGDEPALRDAATSLAILDRQQGREEVARDRLLRAEARLAGSPFQTLLTLERLRPRLLGEEPSAEFLDFVRRSLAGRIPTDGVFLQNLQSVVAHHGHQFPPDVRRQLLEDGGRVIQDVWVRARLLEEDGCRHEALKLLRGFLATSQPPERRLNPAALLVALLPEGAREECLRWCDELEKLLEGPLDDSHIRTDLASALWNAGRQDKRLLERAWRNAERAAGQPDSDPFAVMVNARVRSRIRADQVSLHAQESSPNVRELAAWFTQASPLPEEEISDFRCHGVWCLLASGPLSHPEALVLAERLLGLVPQGPQAQALRVRLEWIRACLATPYARPTRPAAMPTEFQGPFDELPGWAIALAQGVPPRLSAPPGREERGVALAVLKARPDRAETVLEWLFSLSSDSRMIDLVADEVTQASSAVSLQGLLHQVEQLAAEKPSYRLLRLRVALCRRLISVQRDEGAAAYARAVDALLGVARTAEERVEAKLIKGIERMEADQFEASRQILTEAIEEARRNQLGRSELFPTLVSAGNAFRKGPNPDVERALALYSEAEALGAPGEHEAAKLWKVKADALLAREAQGDAAQALSLLERALEVRKTGFLRVETLLSAAKAERALPDREEMVGLRRALDRLDEAERYAEGHYVLWIARHQCAVLAWLVHRQPRDTMLLRRLEQLGQRHPELAEAVRDARQGRQGPVPQDVAESAGDFFDHPAGRALTEARSILVTPDWSMVEQTARRLGRDPAEVRQRLEQQLKSEDRSPRGIRAHADRLAHVNDPQSRPGAMAGRAVLLAHVAEHGLAQREEVERVAHEAEQLIRQMPDSEIKLRLLLELSHIWAPENHYRHPVRDFRRAAELAYEVRAASRPAGELGRSALQSLARATRYRTDGDLTAHFREAERLYEQCVREYEAAREHDVAAHVRMNLADLRSTRGTGNSLEDLQDGIAAARERMKGGGFPEHRARAHLTLAVYLTMSGAMQPPPLREAQLSEAQELFERLDRSLLSPSDLHTADNYRTICLADLAHFSERHAEAISIWRQRLASLDPGAPEEVRAYTVHNLADMLMRPGSTLYDVIEGLELSEKSLQVRTLERYPQHHWETCENIGRTVSALLLSLPDNATPPVSLTRRLWEQGRRALRGALEAARHLGSHERLMRSASALLTLARSAPSIATLEAAAAEGWSALDEARPYLLLDEEAGFMEAHLGVELAVTLAHRLAERGLTGAAQGLGFVLSGERAEFVLRWMARGAGAAQRRLAGRTARPEGVPHGTWVDWLATIHSGDVRAIGRGLDSLRQHAPLFLRGEPELESTWRWLSARPGSAAVSVMRGSEGLIAAILIHEKQRRVFIAALEEATPPYDAAAVSRSLSPYGPSNEYRSLLEWARQGILAPLARLLPQGLSQILWIPTGVLRALAPADLWPGVPVTCAVRLDLESRHPPPRPRRTLLAVADPGPETALSIPRAVEMGARLARRAQSLGPLRVRMSRGAQWGQALGVPCPELVEGPASPEELLRELEEVDLALLLCHGKVEGPREARLLLVDGLGAVAPLDMERLGEDPRRVAGMTVVLLSCETGRVGDWIHQAAGLAGALLAGGARNVIAPLWPVLLEPALEVGHAVLQAWSTREDVAVALQQLHGPESGPPLGGPTQAYREQEEAWSLRAFVHWAG